MYTTATAQNAQCQHNCTIYSSLREASYTNVHLLIIKLHSHYTENIIVILNVTLNIYQELNLASAWKY